MSVSGEGEGQGQPDDVVTRGRGEIDDAWWLAVSDKALLISCEGEESARRPHG